MLNNLKLFINQHPKTLIKYSKKDMFQLSQEYLLSCEVSGEEDLETLTVQNCGFSLPIQVRPSKIKMAQQGFYYLIHGSYADGTQTTFSDIDDIIVLKKEFFESYEVFSSSIDVLHSLNYQYQLTDITQHHGHWVFTWHELLNYDQSLMPTVVFNEAISVFPDAEIKVGSRVNHSFKNILEFTCIDLEKNVRLLENGEINLFFLKDLISGIALFFPLYMQVEGLVLTKKEALRIVPERFESEISDVLTWATYIRNNWEKMPTYRVVEQFKWIHKLIRNRIITERLVSKYAPNFSFHQIPTNGDEQIIDKIYTLINLGRKMWGKG